jgi:hypothetical protein
MTLLVLQPQMGLLYQVSKTADEWAEWQLARETGIALNCPLSYEY